MKDAFLRSPSGHLPLNQATVELPCPEAIRSAIDASLLPPSSLALHIG
jgi:hypothetical protein